MSTPRSAMTKLILQQDPALDNRQVADLLNIPIEVVMNARRYHKVTHKITPRDRGYKQKIIEAKGKISQAELSKQLGCSKSHINTVWRNNP